MAPKLNNIFIDIGAKDKKEVLEMGVHVGCVITYEDEFMMLNGPLLRGPCPRQPHGRLLRGRGSPSFEGEQYQAALYPLRGQFRAGRNRPASAEMVADNIKPNVAIVTDVTHDTHTPLVEKKLVGDVKGGEGPSVTYAPAAVHTKLLHSSLTPPAEKGVPIQRRHVPVH